MNVVVRGLMVAGLFVYASIHLLEGLYPPDGASALVPLAFGASALVAVALGVVLLVGSPHRSDTALDLAALLALGSAIVLALSTTGVLVVTEADLRIETFAVGIAELVVLSAWLANRMLGPEFDEAEEPVPDLTDR